MWITKFSLPWRKTALLSNLARKHRVSIAGYPVSYEIKEDAVYVVSSGIYYGKNLIAFEKDFVKDKRVINYERNGNFGIAYFKQHLLNKYLFQSGIIFVSPGLVTKEGVYIFEIGSWDRTNLSNVIEKYKTFNIKLHWIKQKKISNIQILKTFPALTEKQKNCLQIAIENGYYGYPRKSDLKKLAKIVGISYSTFQFHLRVAEKKVMPFICHNI
jgi:predicted DNA binding protein